MDSIKGINSKPQLEKLLEQLQVHLTANRTDLINLYQQVLRETLFVSRSEIRPAMLGRIAADEAGSLFNFLQQLLISAATIIASSTPGQAPAPP